MIIYDSIIFKNLLNTFFPSSGNISMMVIFYWNIIALQCCVSAVQWSESAIYLSISIYLSVCVCIYIYIYIYISSLLNLLPILSL